MGELVFLVGSSLAQFVERERLGVKLALKEIETLCEYFHQTLVGDIPQISVTLLIVEACKTPAVAERGSICIITR